MVATHLWLSPTLQLFWCRFSAHQCYTTCRLIFIVMYWFADCWFISAVRPQCINKTLSYVNALETGGGYISTYTFVYITLVKKLFGANTFYCICWIRVTVLYPRHKKSCSVLYLSDREGLTLIYNIYLNILFIKTQTSITREHLCPFLSLGLHLRKL